MKQVQNVQLNISLPTRLAMSSAQHVVDLRNIIDSYDNGNITEDEMLNKMAMEAYRFLDRIACEQRQHNQMENI